MPIHLLRPPYHPHSSSSCLICLSANRLDHPPTFFVSASSAFSVVVASPTAKLFGLPFCRLHSASAVPWFCSFCSWHQLVVVLWTRLSTTIVAQMIDIVHGCGSAALSEAAPRCRSHCLISTYSGLPQPPYFWLWNTPMVLLTFSRPLAVAFFHGNETRAPPMTLVVAAITQFPVLICDDGSASVRGNAIICPSLSCLAASIIPPC